MKSAKEIHDDRGRILSETEGVDLASLPTNLMPTTATINLSKKQKSVKEFIEWVDKTKIPDLKTAIQKLEAKETLSEQELFKLDKHKADLKKFVDMDRDKLMAADKAARKEIDISINKKYYKSQKFIKNTTITSLNEGGKMGLQQAVGVLMEEFVRAAFAEVKDAWRNGFKQKLDQSFWDAVRVRLERIAHRLAAKWQDAVQAFRDGAVSGFISNILTVSINCFLTTAAKWVRIIREGAMSLYRALKLLAFPPEGMTLEQAAHEASKLLVAGAVVGLGVLVAEGLSKVLAGASSGILVPITEYSVSVIVGLVTGLTIACATYMLDQLDLFGVNTDKRHDLVMAKLNQIIDVSYGHGMEAAKVFDGPPLLHLPSPS